MDIIQFRLHGQRFMVVGEVMAYNGNLHAEPMEPDTSPALIDLANQRVQQWLDMWESASHETPARGLSRDESRVILERK